ncbi:23S rRNA (guanosine(2251)-2'-O)-methyltransferase RlmB, partial [Microcoleus sp. herbarium19]
MRKFTKPNFSRSNSDSKPFKSEGRRQDSGPSSPRFERKPRPDTRPGVDAPQKRSTFSPQSREMPVRGIFKRRGDSDSQPSILRNNPFQDRDRDTDRDSSPQPARNNFRDRDRDSSPRPARNNFRDRDRDSSPQPA